MRKASDLMTSCLEVSVIPLSHNNTDWLPVWGPLMVVPSVACRFLEKAMSHVSVAYFPQCHMSNLRNDYVPCHYISKPHVACHYVPCPMSNLRNYHVALSILGVRGHCPESPAPGRSGGLHQTLSPNLPMARLPPEPPHVCLWPPCQVCWCIKTNLQTWNVTWAEGWAARSSSCVNVMMTFLNVDLCWDLYCVSGMII